ncbi:protein EXORDIUM-like 2 [Abrus precatorius]|uniref:Protein EXORDIUM-like 2 n=1 Tax=Abrus precatorius TaxID=3816 RepID=A0A8B8K713_ABRPR|nr:protein EXORDIUM-like 2 [Abrus precatorius]
MGLGQRLGFSLALVVASFVLVQSQIPNTWEATTFQNMLALVQEEPVILKYHKGPLLKGNVTVHILWYGNFTTTQRSIILHFIKSLSSVPHSRRTRRPSPSVFSWWRTTARYRGGPCTLTVGNQILDRTYSLGKSLKTTHLLALAVRKPTTRGNEIHVVLTSDDVAVDGFCMSRCGTHGSGQVQKRRVAFAWVGNPATQCPGECAWPFHQPVYGPQSPPLVPPNGDVGVDGMVISLATVLAGVATNPFGNGYYQGSARAPLEAVSACSGIFGKGAYPGYTGNVLVNKSTGGSYNAVGVRRREFLLPAMWDPVTSTCKTLV